MQLDKESFLRLLTQTSKLFSPRALIALLTYDFAIHGLILLCIPDFGYLYTPLQVSRHGARSQALSQHSRLHDISLIRYDRI